LFSGIGGLRAAFHRACDMSGRPKKTLNQWVPVEASNLANGVYSSNFALPFPPLLNRDIIHLEASDLEGADLWLMSPPCQPYTRIGHRLDIKDQRASPLQHLGDLLPKLNHPPQAVLLENVVGFEKSESWRHFSSALISSGYEVRQFQLSPTQIGVPNRRPRIYILARHTATSKTVLHDIEFSFPPQPGTHSAAPPPIPKTLADYLEPASSNANCLSNAEFAVPQSLLERMASHDTSWEVVGPNSTSSSTFTSGYGANYHDSYRFGPLLGLYDVSRDSDHQVGTTAEGGNASEGRIRRVLAPGEPVRLFTPGELLRLAGFPQNFTFPPEITTRQKYKLIGDSINVEVVARLIHFLLFEWATKVNDSKGHL